MDIKNLLWISKISLSTEREDNIRDCFVNQHVDFEYPNSIDEFEYLLEICQRKKPDCKENVSEENIVLDRVIVMDDVSGLANRSETFSNFLTVSRKFGLTCVYVSDTIYPGRQNWQMLIRNCCVRCVELFKSQLSDHYSVNYLGKGRVF